MSKRKLLLSGASIAELRAECEEFLKETDPIYKYPPLPEVDKRQLEFPVQQYPAAPVQSAVHTLPPASPSTVEPVAIHSIPTGAAVDKRGIPWDARVHSGNKEVTVKGAWRKKRGVEDTELQRVEQELLRQVPAGAPAPLAPPAVYPPLGLPANPVLAQPLAPFPLGNALPPVAYPAPGATATPSAPPMNPSTVGNVAAPASNVVHLPPTPQPSAPAQQMVSLAHNLTTFKAQMPLVLAKLVQEGKINQDYIASVKQGCGVQEIWQMNDQQQGEFFEILCQYNLITRMP